MINKGMSAKSMKLIIPYSVSFFTVASITIISKELQLDDIQNVFKPMLMPILILFLYSNTKFKSPTSKFLFFALLFSLIGDVFLMPYYENFMFGLFSFLLAHMFYIMVFIKKSKLMAGLLKAKIIVGFLIVLFSVSFYVIISNMIIKEEFSYLIIPVSVYALVILFMVLLSTSNFGSIKTNYSKTIMIGAILFAISDISIALDKFVINFEMSGFIIMALYTLGQWFIIKGSILSMNNK